MVLDENEKTVEQGNLEKFKERSTSRVPEIMHESGCIYSLAIGKLSTGRQVCTKTMILQLLDMALNDIVPVNTGGIDSFYSVFDKDVWTAMRDLLKRHGIQSLRSDTANQVEMVIEYSCECGHEKNSTIWLNCPICNTQMNTPIIIYRQKDSEIDDGSEHSPILEYMLDRFSTDPY